MVPLFILSPRGFFLLSLYLSLRPVTYRSVVFTAWLYVELFLEVIAEPSGPTGLYAEIHSWARVSVAPKRWELGEFIWQDTEHRIHESTKHEKKNVNCFESTIVAERVIYGDHPIKWFEQLNRRCKCTRWLVQRRFYWTNKFRFSVRRILLAKSFHLFRRNFPCDETRSGLRSELRRSCLI